MIGYFYDIESLENVFSLVNYKDDTDECQIFYLVDNEKSILPDDYNDMYDTLDKRIHKVNKNFKGKISLYDLHDAKSNELLASIFGLSDAIYANNPNKESIFPRKYRLKCDTDNDYDADKDYYLFGYNSYHYDTTMLALYLYETFNPTNDDKNAVKQNKNDEITVKKDKVKITTAKQMRQYNDELFTKFNHNMEDRLHCDYKQPGRPMDGFTSSDYYDRKARIRKNMLMSGRHIDVARLNEKQQKVGLKRLLGMIGYQILESDKLKTGQCHINNFDEFADLIAYNVSDCINLKKLFSHKIYQSAFALKKQLLKDYPELIYSKKRDAYEPDISPYSVRNDRLTIDSSSAQFSTKALCPYGHLKDYKTVSFWYPSKAKAKKMGIEQVNVLEESRNFFYKEFTQPKLRERFDKIYDYYKLIEGKNFNHSRNYIKDNNGDLNNINPETTISKDSQAVSLSDIPIDNMCLPYFNKDGTESSCFVNFSSGGIHGAEYNHELYEHDMRIYNEKLAEYNRNKNLLDEVKHKYSDDPNKVKAARKITIGEQTYNASTFVASKKGVLDWKTPRRPKKPELFKKGTSEKWNISKQYCYTSADFSNHEDFTSYYPNLLRMLDAFYNEGLGYDRYGEIFDNKTRFGRLMKDKSLTESEREMYSTMRNGTKLILNSASGAADATFESNILMNNKIISMRIIGQLFTWRIGQAQTLAGAKITSTNTDGLYSVLEETKNNEILRKESEIIHVEIEPEPVYLISKDTNNRMEVEYDSKTNTFGSIISASGGTLACYNGPSPDKALSHPAVIDWALCEYLKLASQNRNNTGLSKPFNREVGLDILTSARKKFNNDIHTLTMFQNMIASSIGTQRYVFATTDNDPQTPISLQHYNRCFIVKDNTPGSYHLKLAAASTITPAMQRSRQALNNELKNNNPIAVDVLNANGVSIEDLPSNKEAAVVKITNVEESWYMYICNQDLHFMTSKQIDQLFENLDYNKYLSLLESTFEHSWRNETADDKSYKKISKTNNTVSNNAANTPNNPISSTAIPKTNSVISDNAANISDNSMSLTAVPKTNDAVSNTFSVQIFDKMKQFISDKLSVQISDKIRQFIIDKFSEISNLTEYISNNFKTISELTRFINDNLIQCIDDDLNNSDNLIQFINNDLIPFIIEHFPDVTDEYDSIKKRRAEDYQIEECKKFINYPSWTQNVPETYSLKKTNITKENMGKCKERLAQIGIGTNELHRVIKIVVKTLTDTDID